MNLMFNIFLLTLCHSVLFCKGVTKTLNYNQNIHNKHNWILEEHPDDCEGLIFPETTAGFTYLDNLDVKEIVLPYTGEILLSDDTDIQFDADSQNKLNCVVLNQTRYNALTWSDRSIWSVKDSVLNPAIPHQEIPPCETDDIEFQSIEFPTLQLSYSHWKMRVKTLKVAGEKWTNDDIKPLVVSEDINKMFNSWPSPDQFFDITGRGCTDPTGCVCGNGDINEAVCWYGNQPEPDCLESIKPIGFCYQICGAFILFRPKKSFKIDTIREIIKSYSSFSYVSKVDKDSRDYIQVVFTETNFEGTSLDDAKHLHQRLLYEPELGARNIELNCAKVQPSKGSSAGIVFGALFGVAAVFGLIFLAYSPKYRQLIRTTLERRFHLPIRSSRATFTTQFLAKYRKDEDSGPFVDTQSMRGSVVSIEKAFENPMFGQSAPSTSRAIYDTNITPTVMKSEGEMENPLFDAQRLEELREVAENGDLVDLSGSSTDML